MTATAPDDELTLELAHRATAAAQAWQPGVTIGDVQPLTGGMSSLTFLADAVVGSAVVERLVLKVAPPGLDPVRNRDVLRQGRLMRALHGRPGVLVPAVLFEDEGEPPAVSPFLAMPFVAGECVEPILQEPRPEHPPFDDYRARAFAAAEMLAALHALEPERIGLAAEAATPIGAEIDRWTRAFETVARDLQGDYERCAEALHASIPPALPHTVTHGDYRLGNMLCAAGAINAIIDWEIWAIGDPRVDLTWFTFFTDEAAHAAAPTTDRSGMPSPAELVEAYEAATGRAVPDITWFDALTRYKEAAATALLVKRLRKSGSRSPSLERMAPALPALVQEAMTLLGVA